MWAFLSAAIVPLAKKLLLALGVGWVSYSGATILVANVISAIQANWGAVPGAIVQYASLAGIPEAMGIMAGAMTARVALVAFDRFGRISSQ